MKLHIVAASEAGFVHVVVSDWVYPQEYVAPEVRRYAAVAAVPDSLPKTFNAPGAGKARHP